MTTLQELNQYARNVINFLSDNNVSSREGLEALIGTYQRDKASHIEVKRRGAATIKLSYATKDKGMPLELIIDKKNGAMFVIKIEKVIKGYTQSGRDHYGNISQNRKITYSTFSEVLDEIRFLAYHTGEIKD